MAAPGPVQDLPLPGALILDVPGCAFPSLAPRCLAYVEQLLQEIYDTAASRAFRTCLFCVSAACICLCAAYAELLCTCPVICRAPVCDL